MKERTLLFEGIIQRSLKFELFVLADWSRIDGLADVSVSSLIQVGRKRGRLVSMSHTLQDDQEFFGKLDNFYILLHKVLPKSVSVFCVFVGYDLASFSFCLVAVVKVSKRYRIPLEAYCELQAQLKVLVKFEQIQLDDSLFNDSYLELSEDIESKSNSPIDSGLLTPVNMNTPIVRLENREEKYIMKLPHQKALVDLKTATFVTKTTTKLSITLKSTLSEGSYSNNFITLQISPLFKFPNSPNSFLSIESVEPTFVKKLSRSPLSAKNNLEDSKSFEPISECDACNGMTWIQKECKENDFSCQWKYNEEIRAYKITVRYCISVIQDGNLRAFLGELIRKSSSKIIRERLYIVQIIEVVINNLEPAAL